MGLSPHLFEEVLHDPLFRDVGSDGEPVLELSLHLPHLLLLYLRRKPLCPCTTHTHTHTHTHTPHTQSEQQERLRLGPERLPERAASMVETWKSRRASSTWLSRANGSRDILARASEILMIASSCLQGGGETVVDPV